MFHQSSIFIFKEQVSPPAHLAMCYKNKLSRIHLLQLGQLDIPSLLKLQ